MQVLAHVQQQGVGKVSSSSLSCLPRPCCPHDDPTEVRLLRDEDKLGRGGTRANWVLLRIVLRMYRVHRRIQPTAVAALRELEEERGVTGLECDGTP